MADPKGFLTTPREEWPRRPVEERARDWDEVYVPGALPSHILAPGTYTIIAKSGDRTFKRDFTVANGEVAQVEVLMQ